MRAGIFSAIAVLAVSVMLTACATGSDPLSYSANDLAAVKQKYQGEPYEVRIVDRTKFDARFRPQQVAFSESLTPGTIVIDTRERFLYFVEAGGMAWRYGVAVGASGNAWSGRAKIGRKSAWPAWYPTDDMRSTAPTLPTRIAPGPANPLGSRALYLYADGKDTLYRIHGTSEPWTIGTEASSGCIRMFNEDVIDLYARARVGALVIVR